MAVIIINPNSTQSMTDAMVATARRAAPGIAFEGWTSTQGPPSIQGPQDGRKAAPHLLSLVARAVDQKADAIIIGCFDDTALTEAAKIAHCPVIGIGQASYHYAALRNWRFSVVTTLGASVPVLSDNIRSCGLGRFVGRVRASEIPVLALDSDTISASERIIQEANCAISEDGIDAIILGCAGMVQVVDQVRKAVAVNIIDPVACAAKSCAWLT